jgi:hypothetical protein
MVKGEGYIVKSIAETHSFSSEVVVFGFWMQSHDPSSAFRMQSHDPSSARKSFQSRVGSTLEPKS